MLVRWFAHFPQLELADAEEVPAAGGVFARLPFAAWIALEGGSAKDPAFAGMAEAYRKAAPVFFVGEGDVEGSLEKAHHQCAHWTSLVHLALLLDERAPLLPPPRLSVQYVVRLGEGPHHPTSRVLGPTGLETLFHPAFPRVPFTERGLADAGRLHDDRLEPFDPFQAFPGVDAGLQTLEATAQPEMWWTPFGPDATGGFLHAIAAVEHIVLPGLGGPTSAPTAAESFGQHVAALLGNPRSAPAATELFGLRSRLLHGGRPPTADLPAAAGRGRRLLRDVLVQALGRPRGLEPLPAQLARAWGAR